MDYNLEMQLTLIVNDIFALISVANRIILSN